MSNEFDEDDALLAAEGFFMHSPYSGSVFVADDGTVIERFGKTSDNPLEGEGYLVSLEKGRLTARKISPNDK